MTENKRYSFNWKNGHPNFWDNHCDLADCYLTCGDVVNILNELADENEQLKSTIKEVIELLSEEVDLFIDKATEYDINAYIKLKELDDKDAFYMAIVTKKAIKMLKELK